MTLRAWGKGLLLWGLVSALLSAAPALILSRLPAGLSDGFIGILAALLTFSITPLALIVASVGAILWVVAALRRDPY